MKSAILFGLLALSGCSGGVFNTDVAHGIPSTGVRDYASADCNVSYDGLISYSVRAGAFSPLDVRQATCDLATLGAQGPIQPSWARPRGTTHTLFAAASLQEAYSVPGMQSIEAVATAHHVPVTWLIGNQAYLANASLYNAYHLNNGDGVEAEPNDALIAAMRTAFAWYTPTVSIEGAGHERMISAIASRGEIGFWGITWDSRGTDVTTDFGAPWGAYCADPNSYKRPTADGSCALVSLEWTARDLDRAYYGLHEEYFSTDPDDLQQRGGFDPISAAQYERELADAYAAAGETQPLVMVAQQESAENLNSGDSTILDALYGQAQSDGMQSVTFAAAARAAQSFAASPRAIAFPFIPGGKNVPDPEFDGSLYPATIDFHDNVAGMSFAAGHTLPSRVFRYADDPTSRFDRGLALLPASAQPQFTAAAFANGALTLHFVAPSAVHYGIALWSNNTILQITDPRATRAGRAGVVLTFDLQPGPNDITIACPGCSGTTLPYST